MDETQRPGHLSAPGLPNKRIAQNRAGVGRDLDLIRIVHLNFELVLKERD